MESPLPGVHFFRCSSICFQLLYSRGIHVCILQGEGLRGMKDLAALPSFDETSHPFSRHTFANPRPKTKNIQHFIIIHKKMHPKTTNDNGKSTIWTCFSYWTWGFSSVILVSQGCYPTAHQKKKTARDTWANLAAFGAMFKAISASQRYPKAFTCQPGPHVSSGQGKLGEMKGDLSPLITQVHPFCRGNCKGEGDFILQGKKNISPWFSDSEQLRVPKLFSETFPVKNQRPLRSLSFDLRDHSNYSGWVKKNWGHLNWEGFQGWKFPKKSSFKMSILGFHPGQFYRHSPYLQTWGHNSRPFFFAGETNRFRMEALLAVWHLKDFLVGGRSWLIMFLNLLLHILCIYIYMY